MGIAFFRNLFGRRRVTHMPLQPETPPTPQPEQEEQPKTPWQQLVAKEIAQGNITEADRELLHEVDLPDVLNCEAIVENLKKKGYKAADMYLYDMFPMSDHVESVVLLRR